MSNGLVVVTLIFKVLSGPFLRNFKVLKIVSWMVLWLGSACMLSHGVIFDLGSTKVCSHAIIETHFSIDKDIWISVTGYYMYVYLIVLLLLVSILQFINFTASYFI